MAKSVGYFEDFSTPERKAEAYSEGPFVLVPINGWRIECEVRDAKCPALPDLSVYHLRAKWEIPEGKFSRYEIAASLCDRLNEQVRLGNIVLANKNWVVKKSVTGCGPTCVWCKEG